MPRVYHVYILANVARRTYVGMTNDLARRHREHCEKEVDTYVGRFGITRLVRAEPYGRAIDARRRERQLKGWSRAKKHALVESENPQWRDLSRDGTLGWRRP